MIDRITDKIAYEPNTGCWLWSGAITGGGYGHASMGGKSVYAHRLMYEERHGRVPDGLQLDHLCRVRCCVNPDHLEAVTQSENSRRSPIIGQWNRNDEVCGKGHSRADHSRICRNGTRVCKECRRLNQIRYRAAEGEESDGA